MLAIDPPVPYIVPNRPVNVLLVGCGGTGSFLAQSLARIAFHLQQAGPALGLTFMDGDTVEAKNVGRQLFAPAEVGMNKAEALAGRFNAALGLRIRAVAEMADRTTIEGDAAHSATNILVGAVDSAEGRRAMDAGLLSPSWQLWLDCGNHEHAGQVIVGTCVTIEQLIGAFALGGVCAALPAASLLYPELLHPPPAPILDCAEGMAQNLQSLTINQMMASVATEYLYKLIVKRAISTYHTAIDLETLSVSSSPITPARISRDTGVSIDDLRRFPEKGRVAA